MTSTDSLQDPKILHNHGETDSLPLKEPIPSLHDGAKKGMKCCTEDPPFILKRKRIPDAERTNKESSYNSSQESKMAASRSTKFMNESGQNVQMNYLSGLQMDVSDITKSTKFQSHISDKKPKYAVESITKEFLIEDNSNKVYIKPETSEGSLEIDLEGAFSFLVSNKERIEEPHHKFTTTGKIIMSCATASDDKECTSQRNDSNKHFPFKFTSKNNSHSELSNLQDECSVVTISRNILHDHNYPFTHLLPEIRDLFTEEKNDDFFIPNFLDEFFKTPDFTTFEERTSVASSDLQGSLNPDFSELNDD